MSVRDATRGDVSTIADLAARKREQYAEYNPVFHNPAADAREQHAAFIADLIDTDDAISLVYDDDGVVRGFAIGTLIDAPPVYDPGGKTCVIDDFMVDEPDAWVSVGRALLDAVSEVARTRGAAQIVVVCGPDDTPKRTMLTAGGCTVVTEWFTKPI
ncbi:MAG: GNAT family N-acetyltransferase [Gammaproteobacteria bacterium]|nr:GNAT family N-acetyltransferase [Gammaproteobacteria bacterium]